MAVIIPIAAAVANIAINMAVAYGLRALGSLLFPSNAETKKPEPTGIQLPTSSYGVPRPVTYGRNRITGNLIFYGNRQNHEISQDVGGKGGGGSVTVGYTISASFAFDLGYGPTDREVLKVWAGEAEVDSSKYTVLDGTQTTPNSHVQDVLTAAGKTRFPVWKNRLVVLFQNYDFGNTSVMPAFTFEVRFGGADDLAPPTITEDMLTNALYGEGLAAGFINTTVNTATHTFCDSNDLLLSRSYNQQISILDALRDVIDHHNGFISVSDNKIAHGQLRGDYTAAADLTRSEFVAEEGKLPVQVTAGGHREYCNRLMMEWTNRSLKYAVGTCQAKDAVDIRDRGLKILAERLPGLCTYNRASKMTNLRFRRSMWNPEMYQFTLGPKSIALMPGDVVHLTESQSELSSQDARILTISEDKDYKLKITAIEENTELHTLEITGADTASPLSVGSLADAAESVVNAQAMELPNFLGAVSAPTVAIAYAKPDQLAWGGATPYISDAAGGTYVSRPDARIMGQSITGEVVSVNPDDTLTIDLDNDATLNSFATEGDMLADNLGKNIIAVKTASGVVFAKYQTVELVSARRWKLGNVLCDLLGYSMFDEFGDMAATNPLIIFDYAVMQIELDPGWYGKTLYVKVASYNQHGEVEDLAGITPVSVTIAALNLAPLTPCPLFVNQMPDGTPLSGNVANIAFGTFSISWYNRPKNNPGAYYNGGLAAGDDVSQINRWVAEIYNGATRVRTWNIFTEPCVFAYTAADQTTDGMSAVTPLTLKLKRVDVCGLSSKQAVITINRT